MKYPAVLLAATLPWLGLHCEGPPNKPQERPKPTDISGPASPVPRSAAIRPDQVITPSDSRSHNEPASPAEVDSAANRAPATPLELTLQELAAELRLNEEQDAARRAELEAEIVKLREQRQSLYDPEE